MSYGSNCGNLSVLWFPFEGNFRYNSVFIQTNLGTVYLIVDVYNTIERLKI